MMKGAHAVALPVSLTIDARGTCVVTFVDKQRKGVRREEQSSTCCAFVQSLESLESLENP